MGTAEGREHMLKRHDIVTRIIAANSRRLQLESEINGLDIEQRIAERDLTAAPSDSEARTKLNGVQTKITALREEIDRLEAERDWLDQSLAEFDGTHFPPDPSSGRA